MKNAATPPLAIAGWLTGAAQAHLCKNGVTVGDVFLFFGVFARSLSALHQFFSQGEVPSCRPPARFSGSCIVLSSEQATAAHIGGVRRSVKLCVK
jgi:hypothetical protein